MNSPVLMYTTAYCPYCTRAEQLLKARGVADIEKIRVDLEPGLRAEMMQKTGRRTVPQIYIGGQHVGGYDELAALDRQGKLAPMLQAEPAAALHGETSNVSQESTISPKAPS